MNEKTSIKEKISTGVANLKKHWETPPDGYYVNYKEFLNLALGSGSISWLSVIVSWTTIAINIPMMISYFKVSTGFIFVSGIVASIFGLVRAPILSMMIDNSPLSVLHLFRLYRKAGLKTFCFLLTFRLFRFLALPHLTLKCHLVL